MRTITFIPGLETTICFVPDSSGQKIQPLKVENIIWKDLPDVWTFYCEVVGNYIAAYMI